MAEKVIIEIDADTSKLIAKLKEVQIFIEETKKSMESIGIRFVETAKKEDDK